MRDTQHSQRRLAGFIDGEARTNHKTASLQQGCCSVEGGLLLLFRILRIVFERFEPAGKHVQFFRSAFELAHVLFIIERLFFHKPLLDPGGFEFSARIGEIVWLCAAFGPETLNTLGRDRVAIRAFALKEDRLAVLLGAGACRCPGREESKEYHTNQ